MSYEAATKYLRILAAKRISPPNTPRPTSGSIPGRAAGRILPGYDRPIPLWMIFPLIFAAVYLAHGALLRLPYYWDEAGYYIPAAFDFFRTGSLIPSTTLSNAHPPLPSIYLALWWKLSGFSPLVTRTAMCFVAALALLAVYRLAIITTGRATVAAATTLLTALYPIWFAQSTLAHADLFSTVATLWALALTLDSARNRDRDPHPHPDSAPETPSARTTIYPNLKALGATLCFSLAVLSKETALITPLALALWEVWQVWQLQFETQPAPSPDSKAYPTPIRKYFNEHINAAIRNLLPAIPLALWYAYHYHRTGFIFGNPEFLRYNATAILSPLRIFLALGHRLLHITAHMNMFVPVLCTLAAMMFPPRDERDGRKRPDEDTHLQHPGLPTSDSADSAGCPIHEDSTTVFMSGTSAPSQPRISIPRISLKDQERIYFVLAANLIFFSIMGGALLTRYLLPLYPLVLLLCVNTLRRRIPYWPAIIALSAAAFVTGIFVNPPYRFAPEDNLAYADTIALHQHAIAYIMHHFPHPNVLTAWPATDEFTKPELGYILHPVPVTAIDNFSLPQIQTLTASNPPARPTNTSPQTTKTLPQSTEEGVPHSSQLHRDEWDRQTATPQNQTTTTATPTYTTALIFSTKYDPSTLPIRLGLGSEAIDARFFDYHRDLSAEEIARLLNATIVWREDRKTQWAAVLSFDNPQPANIPATPARPDTKTQK
ncbi:MAG TPA: glycosyltransferase family 39 protein [Acidisarcina sp.]